MSEPTDTTGQDPTLSEPAPAVEPASEPQRPVPGRVPQPSGQIPEEELPRRFDNMRGQLQATISNYEAYLAYQQQRVDMLQAALNQGQLRIRDLEAQGSTLQQQVSQLPDLQTAAQGSTRLQMENTKLRVLMNYPSILALTETRQDENGQTVVENPTLDLLLSSSLEGDAFAQHVARFAGKLSPTGQAPAPAPAPPTSPVTLGSTVPPTPLSQARDASTVWNEMMTARHEGRYGDAEKLMDEYQALQYKK